MNSRWKKELSDRVHAGLLSALQAEWHKKWIFTLVCHEDVVAKTRTFMREDGEMMTPAQTFMVELFLNGYYAAMNEITGAAGVPAPNEEKANESEPAAGVVS